MKRNIIALLLTLCLCAVLVPAARAEEAALETGVNLDQLTAHAMELYLALEGSYDSVTPRDSNALSIGFLQWHGVYALELLKRICEADPAASQAALGSAMYNEVLQTPLWSSANGSGWRNRVLSAAEASAVRALISSDLGITCQNQFARAFILEEAAHGWNRGVRTESALLYYCAVEHQYGVGGVAYFMEYVREALGITEADSINSLEEFHNGVLAAAESHSSIRDHLRGREKVYDFIVNSLQLPAGPETNPTPFTDLPEPGHWARAAIVWAWLSDPRITEGSSATTFSPDETVTRGEAVTFLWAAAGQPAPSSVENPFQDVSEKDFYFIPVLWAVESGITRGTTPSSFSPDAKVQRRDMLTFLWAAFGHAAPGDTQNPFSDLRPEKYYYSAVLWAASNGVLVGSEGDGKPDLLRPKEPCTRAYVVTYLFRLFHREDSAPSIKPEPQKGLADGKSFFQSVKEP